MNKRPYRHMDDTTLRNMHADLLAEAIRVGRDYPSLARGAASRAERFARELDARKPKPERSYAWMGWTFYIGFWVALVGGIIWGWAAR